MDNIEKIDLNNIDWKSSKEFFDSIKDELGKLEDHKESYDFTWVGKRKSIIETGAPINKTLRPDLEASKDFANTKNMLIVGDNLDALKILQESYLGQVKMTYIDPPYNTGHDFVYHDNFTIKKDDYEDNATDEDGNRTVSEDEFTENSRSNGRFHSDWLSMIYPRLRLARNLLSDDGVIFISIDDNEQANLKKVCDEVFGEENFVCQIAWRRTDNQPNIGDFAKVKEYILCYAKEIQRLVIGRLPLSDKAKKEYRYKDDKGAFRRAILLDKTRGRYHYEITTKTGNRLHGPWMKPEDEFRRLDAKGLIYWTSGGDEQPYGKIYLNEGRGQISNDFWGIEYGTNQRASSELEKLLNRRFFDFPKPVSLLKTISLLGCQPRSLILDFFAGSGTTGHAVMDLNAEDGGNRRYILVQLPEETNEKSEARKAGYETIDQITAERLRRAGDKIQKEHPDTKIDTGFRVFRIDSSNEKENIRKPLNEYSQESMLDMVENLKPDRAPLDLLFGAIYASALPFDLKLEIKKIGGNTVYLYGYLGEGSGLAACFDDHITEETIREIAKLKTLSAVFKDSSFDNSAAKINLSEHFRILSVDTIVKVI